MRLKPTIGLLAAAILVLAPSAGAAQGNGRIAYASGGSIYTVDPAGGAPKQVHDGFFPSFSPDGTRLVLASWSPEISAYKIWVTDPDGSNPIAIGSTDSPRPFAWSPDGTRVAFDSGTAASGFSIVVLQADGSGSKTLSLDASSDAPPTWSPDGTKLAFTTTSDTDIAVANADGSGRTLLVQDATRDIAPAWSPDGSEIAFFRGAFGQFFLHVIRLDGSGLRQLSQTAADVSVPPAWSPDGKHLLWGSIEPFSYSRFGPYYRSNVYVVGVDGVGERRLTDSPFLDAGSSPVWAPDGRRIAFLSMRGYGNPNRQLFVMNADGTCETQLTATSSPHVQPTWQSLASTPASDPLACAALSITGSLDVETDAPALDDARVYIYRATITNNGNVVSDPLHFVTSDESGPFSYLSAVASSGSCTIGAKASCALSALPPEGTAEIVLRFNMFVPGTFPIEGEVEGSGKTPDGDLSDNEQTLYRQFPFCEIASQQGSTLRAGGDDDLICGTIGRDFIFAGGGNDRVYAGDGHDVVHGGSGADQLNGGGNTDVLYGEGGADKIDGQTGDDVLYGGAGNDILWGENGGDYLNGGPGVDRFLGGYGNDMINSRDGLTEHVYCGEGKDTVQADLRDIVSPDCEKIVRKPAHARAQARAPR
jgi:Tol biopolymer transport system component